MNKIVRQAAAESGVLLQVFGSSLPTSAAGTRKYHGECCVTRALATPRYDPLLSLIDLSVQVVSVCLT